MAWTPVAVDTLKKKRALDHDVVLYEYFSLPVAARHIREFSAWLERRCSRREIAFRPARVRQLVGVTNGYAYRAEVLAARPATDYTARLVPPPGWRGTPVGRRPYPVAAMIA